MKDPKEKLHYIIQQMEVTMQICESLPQGEGQWCVARMVLVYLDSFLKIAPYLNNSLKRDGTIGTARHSTNKEKIKDLDSEYERSMAVVRDRLTAHQQSLSTDTLSNFWQSLRVLGDADGEMCHLLISYADDIARALLPDVDRTPLPCGDIRLDATPLSRNSRTGPLGNSQGFGVPLSEFQGRMQAIHEARENILLLNQMGCESDLTPHSTAVLFSLIACDVCALIEERNARWLLDSVQAYPLVARAVSVFEKDRATEQYVRQFRNTCAAHIDQRQLSMVQIRREFRSFDCGRVIRYAEHVYSCLMNALRAAPSLRFLIAGSVHLRGISVDKGRGF